MTVLPHLVPDELSPSQKRLYDAIAGGPRAAGPQRFRLQRDDGSLTGPFNVLLHAPVVGEAAQALGSAIRFGTALSDRVREIAILQVAQHVACTFEWSAHASIGSAAGLTDVELASLRAGSAPESLVGDEADAHAFVAAVLDGGKSPALTGLSHETQVELTTLVGYYAMLAMYLRVFDADEPAIIPDQDT